MVLASMAAFCEGVFLLNIVIGVSANDGQLIQRPQDETVLLGTESYFACGTSGSEINWLVNGSAFDSLPDKVRSDIDIDYQHNSFGHRFSTLKIIGASKYNGTKIECFVQDGDRSGVATMYLQGVLSSVVNVTVQEIDGSILIYWAAPFSLIPHDIWYDISILNLTNKRGIDCFDCTNITTTNYTFIPDNYGQCYEYVVTITAVNEVGMGEKIHHTVQNSSSTCNNSELDPGGDPPTEGGGNSYNRDTVIAGVCIAGAILLMCVMIAIVYCLRSKTKKNNKYSLEVGGHTVSSDITTTNIDESQGGDLQRVVVTETKETESLVEVEDRSDEEREKEGEDIQSESSVKAEGSEEEREEQRENMQRVVAEAPERTQLEEVAVEEEESVEERNKCDSNDQISGAIMEEKKDPDRLEELVCLPANTESISRNCSVGIDLCTVTHTSDDCPDKEQSVDSAGDLGNVVSTASEESATVSDMECGVTIASAVTTLSTTTENAIEFLTSSEGTTRNRPDRSQRKTHALRQCSEEFEEPREDMKCPYNTFTSSDN